MEKLSELKYKRVLLKLSGEVLAGKQKTGISLLRRHFKRYHSLGDRTTDRNADRLRTCRQHRRRAAVFRPNARRYTGKTAGYGLFRIPAHRLQSLPRHARIPQRIVCAFGRSGLHVVRPQYTARYRHRIPAQVARTNVYISLGSAERALQLPRQRRVRVYQHKLRTADRPCGSLPPCGAQRVLHQPPDPRVHRQKLHADLDRQAYAGGQKAAQRNKFKGQRGR